VVEPVDFRSHQGRSEGHEHEKLTEFYKEISDDKNDFMDYTNLDMLGYKCIQDFFIMINSKA